MSKTELIKEIERLRSHMHELFSSGVVFEKILEVSQQLDELILLYHRITLRP